MKINEKTILILLVMLCTYVFPVCQERCGTDLILEEISKERPGLFEEYEKSFRDFYQHSTRTSTESECPIIIPVHVIILHNPGDDIGEGSNLSEERILSQIEVLNQDFSRTNPDKDLTPSEFNVGDSKIRFYMASVDPEGNKTNGISRYPLTENYNIGESPSIRNTRTKIKEKTGWDRDIYLNIWVAPTLDIIGFAKVPTQTFLPKWNDDGANIHTEVFGGPSFATREHYDMGRTLTHEVGHYLGLGHIWRSNGCTLDDGIADTPLQNNANIGCPNHPTYSCGNDGDMFMNYMDYTYDACMNAFTIDQGAYMRTILNTSRSPLLTSAGYACPDKLIIDMQMLTSTNPTCHGGNDGIIEVSACGGANDNYKYSIDGGPYTSDNIFKNLKAGIHTIRVKNLFGIEGSIDVELINPDPLFVDNIEIESPHCYGSNTGKIMVHVSDHQEILFSLDGINFTNQPLFENLEAGSYEISVKTSNTCIQKIEVELSPPSKLQFEIEEMILPRCYGEKNGRLALNGLGGNKPYSFSLDGIDYQSDSIFEELEFGIYNIYIQDNEGCVFSAEYMLAEPPKLEITIDELNKVQCFGNENGEIEIVTKGGTGIISTALNGQAFTPTANYKNLAAGIYTIEAQDENGCTTSLNYEIVEPEPLNIIEIKTEDVECVGDKNGKIIIETSGGTPDYIYHLDTLSQSSGSFTNLSVGIYPIIVKDGNNCSSEGEAIIKTLSNISLEILEIYPPNCYGENNGRVVLNGNGGIGEYEYSLDNISYQKEPYFDNISGGKSLLYIKDAYSCVATSPVIVPTPSKIEILDLTVLHPTCESNRNGQININATGGSGDLTTKINGVVSENQLVDKLENGNYLIEIIDDNFCKVDSLVSLDSPDAIDIELISITDTNCEHNLLGTATFKATGGSENFIFKIESQENSIGYFDNLGGGVKTLYVNDNNGCNAEFKFEIPVQGGLSMSKLLTIEPKCFDSNDGSIKVDATGGQDAYTFSLGMESNSTGIFENLQGGLYKIIAEDHFGCIGELTHQLKTPGKLKLDTVFVREPTCYNGVNGILDVDASGGKSPILFSLNSRQNYSGVFTNLPAGIHPVTITDGNGCSFSENLILNQPERIKATNMQLISPKCNGQANGAISFDVNGGVGNKIIFYKDKMYDNAFELLSVAAGNYRVRMSDENHCNELLDIFLEEPAELISNDTTIIPETLQNLGELSVSYTGGTRPYLFALNNGDYVTENTFRDLIAGEYSFHIIDAHNCSDQINITVPYDDGFENPDGSVSDIWVSHNPANQTHLHFNLHGDQEVFYQIFSIDGKMISTDYHTLTSGQYSLELPITQQPSGTYVLRFNAERDYRNLRFVKF